MSDADRLVPERADESGNGYRSGFRRDYARLIHSPAFRRLQGKTQLFPSIESDFFRNRLTHSLEVAQIAKSIALRLNHEIEVFRTHQINVDVVEVAGLAHDLGHPPFGHNGEAALDECMRSSGGFEGNAQTLRIIARLEKKHLKETDDPTAKALGVGSNGVDHRAGLNLCARTLASVLKYDRQIPTYRAKGDPLVKGYYESEADVVRWVREQLSVPSGVQLKTIECQIMDIADDIAYSTYDLEDAFKAGFLSPLEVLSFDADFYDDVSAQVSKALSRTTGTDIVISARQVVKVLAEVLNNSTTTQDDSLTQSLVDYKRSRSTASNGFVRTLLTSDLVGTAVEAVELQEQNGEYPLLSRIGLRMDVLTRVEILKRLTFSAVIMSARLKVSEFRGREIVMEIFRALEGPEGHHLLPRDCFDIYERFASAQNHAAKRRRVLCDFIAGMTDAYAIEFYARLKSENARTIFKPL